MRVALFNKSIASAFLLSLLFFCSCEGPVDRTKVKDSFNKEDSILNASESESNLEKSSESSIKEYSGVDFYLENSGSMDGYVADKTEFPDHLKNVLYAIDNGEMNLYYANKLILKINKTPKDFFAELNPTSFKKEGGNRASTDIAELLDSILSRHNKKNITVIASDFIFSPGKDKDAENYLKDQRIEVKRVTNRVLKKHKNISIMVYRFISSFNGNYYNKIDSKSYITHSRPFFIWIIGDKEYLRDVKRKFEKENIDFKNSTYFSLEDENNIEWRVIAGKNMRITPGNKHSIENLEKDPHTNLCKFKIEAKLPLLLDESYILDTSNYICDKGYTVSKVSKVDEDIYRIDIQSPKAYKKITSVSLKNNTPSWVSTYNDTDGDDITQTYDKTYGLEYLLGGVKDAFDQDNYAIFKIQIK